jgi:hypothetical protein
MTSILIKHKVDIASPLSWSVSLFTSLRQIIQWVFTQFLPLTGNTQRTVAPTNLIYMTGSISLTVQLIKFILVHNYFLSLETIKMRWVSRKKYAISNWLNVNAILFIYTKLIITHVLLWYYLNIDSRDHTEWSFTVSSQPKTKTANMCPVITLFNRKKWSKNYSYSLVIPL